MAVPVSMDYLLHNDKIIKIKKLDIKDNKHGTLKKQNGNENDGQHAQEPITITIMINQADLF